jgi:leucyl-tRNA synthetase
MVKYDHSSVESKWQAEWRKANTYKASNDTENKYYMLVELTYTSGDLHIGHWFAWSAPDVFARFKRMQGYNVLFPVGGFDAFGLPAENAAIKHDVHPREWTYKNIDTMRKQFVKMGPSFDWEKEVITADPKYYKWTQWLFLKLYEADLAYKDSVLSNWCPDCKTVLANEHVVDGCCWRHTATKVVQKEVPQWLFRITKYADKLIWPEKPKVNWPKEAVERQNNWIGKSQGIKIDYEVEGASTKIPVFTTRPDTIRGVTFIVLSPEHPQALKITTEENKQKVSDYINEAKHKPERERLEEVKGKTGVFTGAFAINPITKGKVPIWIGDFVLMSYGTGAVMGVPAHDERDNEFAKKHNLPVTKTKLEDFDKISKYILDNHLGEVSTQYHLRDWTISRQRYWGAPIPIIYCDKCGTVPVPEKDLPVVLPEKVDYTPTGKAPLATAEDWMKVKCPNCGGEAKRDTETMDTYVDSSWYFLRYPDPKFDKGIFSPKSIKDWLPIEIYFGGPEHILGHTLYARFITKVLHDLGYLHFDEFAKERRHHGVILGTDGYRMSKSRGNVVNPDEQVDKYGADTVRMYLCFLGPHERGGTWELEGIEGMYRFLNRVWRLFLNKTGEKVDKEVTVKMHQTIKKVTKDLEEYKFNTAIAAIMEFSNVINEKGADKDVLKNLALLLAPFAPHLAEELWVDVLGEPFSIHKALWPHYNAKLAASDKATIIIQVNGRLRSQITLDIKESKSKESVIKLAMKDPKVEKWIEGGRIRKEIFIPGKLVNFVV